MTAGRFDAADHARRMRAGGFWPDIPYDLQLVRALAATPDKPALVANRADREGNRRISYRELGDLVARAAAALRGLGVGPGDIVAVQLPNWWEFVVVALAANRIGAVVNPLMPIFRERELGYMLGFAESKVLVVPQLFRGFDHAAMAQGLRASCPKLEHVIVVDGSGADSFERMLLAGSERVEPTPVNPLLAPDATAVVMFTSGTTGSPKGAIHTTNTLQACNAALAGRFGLVADDVMLACSPLGHMTGYAAVMLLGLSLGATVVLQDLWEARRGVGLMADEGVTFMAAATPFLADICDAVAGGAPRPTRLRNFLCAGAPIPPVLIERAARELDLKVCSLWGMTESLSSTLTEPSRAHDKSPTSDGRALEGVEVKVVDFDGRPAPVGETGRLLVRGAQMFMGYYKRPDIETFDAEGWFDSGDLAYADAEGYIRINGRTKDVLIRGGENVPVFEIESLLYKHPAVAAAALVGYPDERLGERGCAFVVLRPGASLTLADVQAYMADCKVAKQYWPERVEILADLPRTPSGKIQKFKLREAAARGTLTVADGDALKLERPGGGIGLLTLNRPEALNALTDAMVADLGRLLDDLAADSSVRVLVLTGAGRGFCAGFDLGLAAAAPDEDEIGEAAAWTARQERFAGLVTKLRALRQPVIAAVNGPANGGGLALALAAEIRYAGASARFNAAFVKVGMTGCDMGVSWLLPRSVGLSRSFEILLTGRLVDAAEAERIGLVSATVADAELLPRALATAREIAAHDPLAMWLTKRGAWANAEAASLQQAIELENRSQILARTTGGLQRAAEALLTRKRSRA